jgi:hypothetical protein
MCSKKVWSKTRAQDTSGNSVVLPGESGSTTAVARTKRSNWAHIIIFNHVENQSTCLLMMSIEQKLCFELHLTPTSKRQQHANTPNSDSAPPRFADRGLQESETSLRGNILSTMHLRLPPLDTRAEDEPARAERRASKYFCSNFWMHEFGACVYDLGIRFILGVKVNCVL